jgi:cytoskeletal protein RodZ
MKKLPIIMIPAIVVILLLGGAFVWKMMQPSPATKQAGTFPNAVGGSVKKPTNPFSFLFGSQTTPIPTPTPASAAAMNADLQTVGDDGGASDFSSLQKDASGL